LTNTAFMFIFERKVGASIDSQTSLFNGFNFYGN